MRIKNIIKKIVQIPYSWIKKLGKWIISTTTEETLGMIIMATIFFAIASFLRPERIFHLWADLPLNSIYWQNYFYYIVKNSGLKYMYFLLVIFLTAYIGKRIYKKRLKFSTRIMFLAVGTIIAFIIYFAMPSGMLYPKTEQPNVKIFFGSFGGGSQGSLNSLKQINTLLDGEMELEPHFFIYENYSAGNDANCIEDGAICSKYGYREVEENVRQACIMKYEINKYWSYQSCIVRDCDFFNLYECWGGCADEANLDMEKLFECQEEEGIEILRSDKGVNRRYGIKKAPTILINGYQFSGQNLSSYTNDLLHDVCLATNNPSEKCNEIFDSGIDPRTMRTCKLPNQDKINEVYEEEFNTTID